MTRRFLAVFLAFALLAGMAYANGGGSSSNSYSFSKEKYSGKGKVKSSRFSGYQKYRNGRYLKDAYMGIYFGTSGRFGRSNIFCSAEAHATTGLYLWNTYNELAGFDVYAYIPAGTNYINVRLFGSDIYKWGIGHHSWNRWGDKGRKWLGSFPMGGVNVTIYFSHGIRYYGSIDVSTQAGPIGINSAGTIGFAPWVSLQALAGTGINVGLELMAQLGTTEANLDSTLAAGKPIKAVGWISILPIRLYLNFLVSVKWINCKKRKKGIYCGWRKKIKTYYKVVYRKNLVQIDIGSQPVLYFIKKDPEGDYPARGKSW